MMETKVNIKQLRWIHKKELFLLEKYGGRKLSEKEYEEVMDFSGKVYEDSKHNKYCKAVMLRAINAIENDDKQARGIYEGDKA